MVWTVPAMPMKTGTFDGLGISYEEGSNAALLSAIARSAEELTSGKGWPEGVNDLLAALGRVTGVSRVWIFQTLELTDTHITQNYTFEWAAKRPSTGRSACPCSPCSPIPSTGPGTGI